MGGTLEALSGGSREAYKPGTYREGRGKERTDPRFHMVKGLSDGCV